MDKVVVMQKLSDAKEHLRQYGVSAIGLFGSTVREENRKDSDIDILIDFVGDQETYINYLAVCALLEQLFENQQVDIVTRNGLSQHIGPAILKEVEYV